MSTCAVGASAALAGASFSGFGLTGARSFLVREPGLPLGADGILLLLAWIGRMIMAKKSKAKKKSAKKKKAAPASKKKKALKSAAKKKAPKKVAKKVAKKVVKKAAPKPKAAPVKKPAPMPMPTPQQPRARSVLAASAWRLRFRRRSHLNLLPA